MYLTRTCGRVAFLAITVLLVLFFPAVVTAHSELESSRPAEGASVPSPFDGPIVLRFDATLASGSKADLLGPDGTKVASATVDGPGATMTIPLEAALAAGSYEVKWVSVADDGDLRRGTLTFTVAAAQPTASPSSSPTPAATPSAAAFSPSAAPSIAGSPSAPGPEALPTGNASTSGGDVVLPMIVALIVVGGGAVYLLSRRNRPTTPG
jgi:methionine-rich copper-binding protein CopC